MRAPTLLALIVLVLICGCTSQNRQVASVGEPPAAPREFRAVWVATVANIDWPSKPGLSTDEQKREAIAILDRAKETNLNAIVLQVRPAADALYASRYEPWSYYLTGKQGQPPEPYYDPLEFWVAEAHKRGMELHAWFNPYRARHSGATFETAPNHVSKTNPQIVREFNKWQWLDPAEPAAQDLTFNVFMDVVKRYDVDGIHIDDYFYPYPEYLKRPDGKFDDFPDDATWQKYQQRGGTLRRDDWRREQVSTLIHRIYDGAHAIKNRMKFGISPFGIARPGHPKQVTGFDQYDKLYADTEKWLREGWCDYWTPQLYWKISSTSQPYVGLLEYWVSINDKHRHIWPGNSISNVRRPDWGTKEIVNQIEETRKSRGGATGNVFFSMKSLMSPNNELATALRNGPYAQPSIVPASTWLDNKPPSRPNVRVKRDSSSDAVTINWSTGWFGEKPWQWAVWAKYGDQWRFFVYPANADGVTLDADAKLGKVTAVCVSAVDRCGNESERITEILRR
jgi:uncharacterized lipoprotein YddW (UPF0748 family)